MATQDFVVFKDKLGLQWKIIVVFHVCGISCRDAVVKEVSVEIYLLKLN